jgi:hypothetical protein
LGRKFPVGAANIQIYDISIGGDKPPSLFERSVLIENIVG